MARNIVALCPAFNEAASIAATIEALLAQTRPIDTIVIIPNGCSDNTAEIARSYTHEHGNLVVLELPRLKHRKSEALNRAWLRYGKDADIVICLDADTIFPPDAVYHWELDFVDNQMKRERAEADGMRPPLPLGGSASKVTMPKEDVLSLLQRAEFAESTDASLMRGFATVLPGAGAALNGELLRRITTEEGRLGPWSYTSEVEDYELTLQMRERGYLCMVSPWVRMYTDSMTSLKSLWTQRMKWSTGTVQELLAHGVTRLTLVDWSGQLMGFLMLFIRLIWVTLITLQITIGMFEFHWFWWTVYPAFFGLSQLWMSRRIPHTTWKGKLLAVTILPYELFGWMRVGWFTASWLAVAKEKLTGRRKDRWEIQYRAEGVNH